MWTARAYKYTILTVQYIIFIFHYEISERPNMILLPTPPPQYK